MATQSFACQADGAAFDVVDGRVVVPSSMKRAEAARNARDVLARQARAANALRAAAALDRESDDSDSDGSVSKGLIFDGDAVAAHPRPFLHVSDIRGERPPRDEPDEVPSPVASPAGGEPPSPAPYVVAPRGGMKERLADLDRLAKDLEDELAEGHEAIDAFAEKAQEQLVDRAAKSYAILAAAGRAPRAEPASPPRASPRRGPSPSRASPRGASPPPSLRSPGSLRGSTSPPPPPVTASAELRARDGVESAWGAYEEVAAALAAAEPAPRRRKKKRAPPPRPRQRPQWRDPKGTALW